jgi:hypothetical protein
MLRTFRRLALIVAGAALIAAAVPTPATAAPAAAAPCQARSIGGFGEWTQTVAVAGAYAPRGAIDVRLTCGVVQFGEVQLSFTDGLAGPVAALAGTGDVYGGAFTVCFEAYVRYIDRTSFEGNCP